MFEALLSALAPHLCIQCGVEGTVWCLKCRDSTPITASRCYRCHQLTEAGRTCQVCRHTSALFSVRAATRYEGSAKQLVWRLKFERARAAADTAAEVMAARLTVPHDAVIAFAPAVTSHVRRRGYDQAELIAAGLAKRINVPYRPLLIRLGQRQQRGRSRKQRLMQLENAFRAVHVQYVAGAHVVLVDDVITTGATLEAAARALKVAGARRVSAVVFAQA